MPTTTLNWPNVAKPSFPQGQQIEDIIIRSTFEDGSSQSRPRATRARKTWPLKWNVLSDANRAAIEDFYDLCTTGNTAGCSCFNWMHPYTGRAYVVEFTAPPDFSQDGPNRSSGTVTIREV